MTRWHARPDPRWTEPGPPFSAKEILRAVPVAVFVVGLFLGVAMFLVGVPVESNAGWWR